MIIDKALCIGCGNCVFTCTVSAIHLIDETAQIDRDHCVECGNCLRIADCPTEALQQDELSWPRVLRKYFSDNQSEWPEGLRYSIAGTGRGTEECKTNDRTGRFKQGEVGIVVELGRPGISTKLYNAEKIIQALLASDAKLEANSPVTALLADKEKGLIKEEVRDQRVLSCIVEAKVNLKNLAGCLSLLKDISVQIDTVFTLGLVTRMQDGFISPIEPILNQIGLTPLPNSKVNLGLGKPLCRQ